MVEVLQVRNIYFTLFEIISCICRQRFLFTVFLTFKIKNAFFNSFIYGVNVFYISAGTVPELMEFMAVDINLFSSCGPRDYNKLMLHVVVVDPHW